MTDKHPINPPATLVAEWASESLSTQVLCTRAARWGADQELEACVKWILEMNLAMSGDIEFLRTARRPAEPNLKEQGLVSLNKAFTMWMTNDFNVDEFVSLGTNIRCALEALPEGAQ